MIRRFELHRDEDVTGVSGTGVVAEGAILSSGKAIIEWLTEWPTSVVWHDRGLESVEHVHGHNGRTRIVWVDGDPRGEPLDLDRLYLDLKGSRERLCRSQVNVPDHWRADLGDALRIVDLVGSAVCPQQWSKHDQPEWPEVPS